MMLAKFLLFALFHSCAAVIYELNDADYALMPPIFLLDDYEECLREPQGLYCTADYAVVSDEPSPLLTMMQEYSEHTPTHYNHTLLRRGVCITQTCRKFYEKSEEDLGLTLEACANETLYNKYKLKARVSNGFDCSNREKNQPIDNVDIAVGAGCVAVLLVNIIGSICDYFFEKEKPNEGLRFLYCFSIFRNWNKLVAPAADGREPRLKLLRSLHGVRSLNMILVIAGHSIAVTAMLPENASFVEAMLTSDPIMHILANGTVIMQTFLLISSFLLVYIGLIYSEKHEPSWKMLPKQFMLRWLRLTPSYAVTLALTVSWLGRLTSGPYWKKAVGDELIDCRRYWWMHLLYINNYFDKSECMGHSWYLATDLQLYFMASIIFVMCRSARPRKVVLGLLFVLGVIVPTLQTYYQNLDGVLLCFPEFAVAIFHNYPTFDHIYKRGHTNLIGYVIGMAMGYWVYDWQKAGGDTKIFQKYRFLFWSLLPLGFLCCYSGSIFYSAVPSTTINLLFAAFMKPIFAIIVGTGIVGFIIQFEDIYRPILEWSGWTVPSRLTFSAYLLHMAFLRNFIAMQTTTYRVTYTVIVARGLMLILCVFISTFFFWILVEAPSANLIRQLYIKPEPIEGSQEVDKDSKKKLVSKKKKGNGKKDDKRPKKKKKTEIVDKTGCEKVENKIFDKKSKI